MIQRLVLTILFAAPVLAQSLAGLWDCTVTANGVEIPFRMEFSGDGTAVRASFFNVDEKVTSASGRCEKGSLEARFDYYNSRLEATWRDGRLTGAYLRDGRMYPFRAQ